VKSDITRHGLDGLKMEVKKKERKKRFRGERLPTHGKSRIRVETPHKVKSGAHACPQYMAEAE